MALGVLTLAWAGGIWVPGVLALAAITAGHLYSYRTRDRIRDPGGRLLTLLLALAFLYMVADLATAFAGGAFPQGQFGMASQAITSFRLRTRRDLYATMVHSLVLFYVAADVSYSPLLLVFLLGYGFTTLVAFATASIVDAQQVAQPPSAGRPGRSARISLRSGFPALLWASLSVTSLSILLFIGIPRFGSSQMVTAAAVPLPLGPRGQSVTPLFPLVSLTASGSTGTSPRMDLAYRGRPSYETVMYVRSQVRSYWRALTFDKYDGQGWHGSLAPPSRQRRGARGGFDMPAGKDGMEYVQTYSIIRDQSDALFTGYWAELVQYPDTFMLRNEDVLLARQPIPAGTTYTVLSRLPAHDLAALGHASHQDARYTALPALSPRVHELARQVTSRAGSDYEKAAALERYLRTNYRYDLNVPSLREGADAVEVFLFDHRRGFCQQFATAMAVMGRVSGLPTRVVTGYLPGQYDPVAGAFVVRAADAHSWVEVHFEGHGWVPFDPTPEVGGNARDHAAMAWLAGNWGGPTLMDLGVALGPVAGAIGEGFAGMAGMLGSAATMLVAVLIAGGGIALIRRLPTIPWPARLGLARTPREIVLQRYTAMEQTLTRLGVPRRASWETPTEHLGRAEARLPAVAEELQAVEREVTAAVYSPSDPDTGVAERLLSLHRRLQGHGA